MVDIVLLWRRDLKGRVLTRRIGPCREGAMASPAR
jgi:hypothetical protein